MAKKNKSTGDGSGFLFILLLLAAAVAILNALIPIVLGLFYIRFAFKYRFEIGGFWKNGWRSIISFTEEAKLLAYQRNAIEYRAKYKFVQGKLERSRSQNSISKWLMELQKLAETIEKLELDFNPYLQKYKIVWNNLRSLYSLKNGFFMTSIAYWFIGDWVSNARKVSLSKIIPLSGIPDFELFSVFNGAFFSMLIVIALTVIAFLISLLVAEYTFKLKYGSRDKYQYDKEKLNFEEIYKRFSQKLNNSNNDEESWTQPTSRVAVLKKYLKMFNLEAHQLCKSTLKARFRELMKKYHPDTLVNATKFAKEKAEKKTREIIEAYEYLIQMVA
jgi:hypothetical protein